MAIRFIRDHEVKGSIPPVIHRAGDIATDMTEASERHFVSRGSAVPVAAEELRELEAAEKAAAEKAAAEKAGKSGGGKPSGGKPGSGN